MPTVRQRQGTAVIDVAIDIDRPVQAVFDYCSDHTHEIEWNPKMRHVAKLTEGPVGLGTRYQMEFLRGRPMTVGCVRFERPVAWTLAGETKDMRSEFEGRVVAVAEGTHLMLRMVIAPRGALRLALPLLRAWMPRQLKRDIGLIKTRLESIA